MNTNSYEFLYQQPGAVVRQLAQQAGLEACNLEEESEAKEGVAGGLVERK